MRQTVAMYVTRIVAGSVLLALVVGACQDPAGESPDATTPSPVAPGVEPSHPDAERTIPLPSGAPVAPAVEPSHPDAERTIPLPSEAPIAPAGEPEPTGPEPTVQFPAE
jgi:hypothetical protein